MADKIQIFSPFDSTIHQYGLRVTTSTNPHSYVNTPAHPLGGSHYYVKVDMSHADAGVLTALHTVDLEDTVPAGYRSAIKLSMFFRTEGPPDNDSKMFPWLISGISYRTYLRLSYDSDGKVRLRYGAAPGTILAASTATLPENEDIQLIFWMIYRDAGGNRINDQYVCQLVEDPLTATPTVTTLFNVQDTQQESPGVNALINVMWKEAGNQAANNQSVYGGSFYAGWEDADNPSGVVKDAFMVPATGTPTYDEWTVGAGDATDKWKNVDEAAPDDDTTYHYAAAATEFRQSHCLPDTVVPADNTVLAVAQLAWLESQNASKAEYIKLIITDGTNVLETAASTIDDAGYQNFYPGNGYCHIWQTAPDAGAWTPTDLDDLEIGYREGNGGFALSVSATLAIVAYYDPDVDLDAPPNPPAVGAARRIFIC